MLHLLHQRNAEQAPARLQQLQQIAVAHGNLFAELMETVRYCSLGQITNALFEVGGQYRRNMYPHIVIDLTDYTDSISYGLHRFYRL
jgi:isobutyryl-CoA mutase